MSSEVTPITLKDHYIGFYMKPLGQKTVRFPYKEDCHIRENNKSLGNWWEEMNHGGNKALYRRQGQLEIDDGIDEYYDDIKTSNLETL